MPDSIQFDAIGKFCGNNGELFRKVVSTYMDTGREDIQELVQAVQKENWSDVREKSHKLLNFTSMIGAETLENILRLLERDPAEVENARINADLTGKIEMLWNEIEKAAVLVLE